jgi:hypothetical protein
VPHPGVFDFALAAVRAARWPPPLRGSISGVVLFEAEFDEAPVGTDRSQNLVDADEELALLAVVLASVDDRKWWTKCELFGYGIDHGTVGFFFC